MGAWPTEWGLRGGRISQWLESRSFFPSRGLRVGFRPFFGVWVCLLFSFACGHTQSIHFFGQEELVREIQVVGILPLENLTDDPKAAQVVTDLLITELHHLKRFQVIGPLELKRMFQEQGIHLPKIIDRAIATEIGRRIEADGIFIGSVSEYQYQSGLPAKEEEEEPVVGINLRLINVRTSTVVWGSSYARSSYEAFSYEKDALTQVVIKALRGMLNSLKQV